MKPKIESMASDIFIIDLDKPNFQKPSGQNILPQKCLKWNNKIVTNEC